MKPVLEQISSWYPGTGLLYKCPKCGTSFRIFGNDELYCHHCGIKIDWDNIPTNCDSRFSTEYHKEENFDKQKIMISYLNDLIQNEELTLKEI